MSKMINISDSEKKIILELHKKQGYCTINEQQRQDINPKRLKFGDGGKNNPNQVDAVKQLQQKLIDKGLLKTKTGIPTGYFGDLTQSALDRYNKGSKGSVPKEKTQTQPSKTVSAKYSPRIDAELNFIIIRDKYPHLQGGEFKSLRDKSKSFFIYDSKYNLLYLFSPTYQLIAYTSVVDGADPQKEKNEIYTTADWCKASGLKSTPHLCTDKTGSYKSPYYATLLKLKERFLAKGIYSIDKIFRKSGYSGKGTNVYGFKDEKGDSNPAAIHGIPNIKDRLIASDELQKKLKTDLKNGKVPQEYLNDVNLIANANMSFGCIGVPAEFVDNPKVIDAVKIGTQLFVIGENNNNYLVQNSNEFFDRLGSDVESCINPTSLAQQIGSELPKITGNENYNIA
jgi:hypothetical protein